MRKSKNFKKKPKKPSIKDIAAESGVAISTVSHVLNKTKFVSEKTTKKVLKVVNKFDYKPNIIARGLRIKSTEAVGVIVPDIATPFFSQVIRGMEEVARKRRYTLILGCTFYDVEEEKRQMDILMDQFIDGLVFFCGYDSYKHIKKINSQDVPVVVVDREIKDNNIPSVLIDNVSAMEKAVDYLYSIGHKKIGYISFPFKNQTTSRNRYKGYCRSLKKHNISYNPDYVIIDGSINLNELKGTYNIMRNILNQKKPPTAFVTQADFIAIGLIKALKEKKYKVPFDVSVCGFNNEIISEFTEPSLTTVKQPKKLMGQIAMNLLIDIIEGKPVENKNIILPTELIIRKSTGPPPK
jgi:DNA-binding LacI/PurR family transcriptional regulator